VYDSYREGTKADDRAAPSPRSYLAFRVLVSAVDDVIAASVEGGLINCSQRILVATEETEQVPRFI
jgi:hypothetical protein